MASNLANFNEPFNGVLMTLPRHTLLIAVAVMLSGSPAQAKICVLDNVPAATLLVPYIDQPLDACDDLDQTSSITVQNHSTAARRAKFTIWSNLGVPVFQKDVIIQGGGSQEFAFGQLLCTGSISELSIALSDAQLAHLQAYLSGRASPTTGDCASITHRQDVAQAYVTVDHILQETSLTPANSGYYSDTVIGRDNAFTGHYRLIDIFNNFAQRFPAVSIEATPQGDPTFVDGSTTFYGRYNGTSAADGREPLPTAHAARFDLSGDQVSSLYVWREADGSASPVACDQAPSWYPLRHNDKNALVEVDSAGRSDFVEPTDAFPVATQRVDLEMNASPPNLPMSYTSGWLRMILQHDDTAYGAGDFGQSWVSSTQAQVGRYQAGATALALDTSCSGSDISVSVEGRAQ